MIFGCNNPTGSGSNNPTGSGSTIIYTLRITVTPEGYGTVEVSPAGAISAQGTREYVSGTVITVTAEGISGYILSSWEGASVTVSDLSTLLMDGDKDVKAHFIIPAVGASCQGGIIAYILQVVESNGICSYDASVPHGFIAASSDLDPAPWSNITNSLVGASGEGLTLGTGRSNTAAIIGQTGHTSSAAFACRNYSSGGYSDWFLPSRDEINKLYLNSAVIGGFTTAGSNTYYWDSSEDYASYAGYFRFLDGYMGSYGKQSSYRVRPVRAF
jgi:hypothetical protein